MVLGYSAGADAGATITPRACNPPQRRRRSATRGAYANCAQACDAHVKCCGARVPPARRVERASQRRLSDVSAPDAAEYARANEVLCGALWPQPAAQQALQRVSVSLSHMLAADLGAAFGAAASVLPVGGARIAAASALGLRAARGSPPS